MLNKALLSLAAFMFSLSLILLHRVSVLERDSRKLQRDVIAQLNQRRSEQVDGKLAKMSRDRKAIKPSALQRTLSSLQIPSKKVKREQSSCRAPTSVLQFSANSSKQPDRRGDIAVIPWTVSAQQGSAISPKENRIVVQADGFYMVFGQVLFKSPSTVMGHIIRSWESVKSGTTATELLRCLQEMPDQTPANTCHTAGIVQLHQRDKLELVIPHKPQTLISMDAASTFFGVIKLN